MGLGKLGIQRRGHSGLLDGFAEALLIAQRHSQIIVGHDKVRLSAYCLAKMRFGLGRRMYAH